MAKANKKAAEKGNRAIESSGPVSVQDMADVVAELKKLTKIAEGLGLFLETKEGGVVTAYMVKSRERARKGYEAFFKGVKNAIDGKKRRGKAS